MRNRIKFLNQFAGFDLKHIKKIDVKFNPFHPNAANVREFYQGIAERKSIRSNTECTINAKVVCDKSDPLVTVQFADEHKLVINSKYLHSDHIIKLIKELKEQHKDEEL